MALHNSVGNSSQTSTDSEIALSVNRVAFRVPSFIPADPELWFAMVESSFANAKVTTDATKFSCVIEALEPRYALEVRDIIVNKPERDAYEILKAELVKRLSTSKEQKTRRLLEMEELGDRKPSQFLRHLKGLAGSTVPESMLRTLWFARIPTSMQAILAAHRDLSLEKLADIADSIMDLTDNCPRVAETMLSPGDQLAAQLQQLTLTLQREIASIKQEVSELRYQHKQRSRSRSSSRPRFRNRSASSGSCWYHRKFGSNARKCTQPCSFQTTDSGNATGSR
ncbi:uncharacterized protein LOC112905883 [Agrilus planipennis]|uniref:Uncharacterized protein LOC112905883 n=1 Tax=Agrilus planipennis TaxID=224129 RepID=A0A7F5RG70_AGRPL|nr:uncharacterized protein LOC112905883 [Agrilus planipennis]